MSTSLLGLVLATHLLPVTFEAMRRVSVMIYMIFCRFVSLFIFISISKLFRFLNIYLFCQEFFKAHPNYTDNEFYITGESYAGHYIPAFASRVHQGNKDKEGIPINLKVCN